ncbi:hypothetical protein, partial [Mycobacterium sp.]|uniref:hypothetical protein n=1 Tax=Mycobacterium sp. TaxID=1785 RepID=UPI0026399A7D
MPHFAAASRPECESWAGLLGVSPPWLPTESPVFTLDANDSLSTPSTHTQRLRAIKSVDDKAKRCLTGNIAYCARFAYG